MDVVGIGWEVLEEEMCYDNGVAGGGGFVEGKTDGLDEVIGGPGVIVGPDGLVGGMKETEFGGLGIWVGFSMTTVGEGSEDVLGSLLDC